MKRFFALALTATLFANSPSFADGGHGSTGKGNPPGGGQGNGGHGSTGHGHAQRGGGVGATALSAGHGTSGRTSESDVGLGHGTSGRSVDGGSTNGADGN